MINKNMLKTKLTEKFKTLTLHSIVNECFIVGLSPDLKSITESDVKSLSRYSLSVLEAVGGFDCAVKSLPHIKDVKQRSFLMDILNTCTTAATEAAKRIVDETDCKSSTEDANKIIDKATFTEAEYNSFKKNTENFDIKKIGEIINEKTIAVIREEKEIQEQDAAMKDELTTAIGESKNFKDMSLEGYLDLSLKKDVARTPISFFSKVLEASYENMLYSKEEYNEIPFKTLKRITLESTLGIFKRDKTPMECLESVVSVNCAPTVPTDEERTKMMDTAMLCSAIVYTVLQTLKTLHIYSPQPKEIESFVKNTPACDEVIMKDRNTFINHCTESINDIRKSCIRQSSPNELMSTRNKLIDIKDKLAMDTYDESHYVSEKSKVMATIESLITVVTEKIHTINEGINAKPVISAYDKRAMESDVAGFNRINNLFGKNNNISDICILFYPASEASSILDIECRDQSGQITQKSFIPVQYKPKVMLDYVKESFGNSKLKDSKKNIYLCTNDGTGTKVKLN